MVDVTAGGKQFDHIYSIVAFRMDAWQIIHGTHLHDSNKKKSGKPGHVEHKTIAGPSKFERQHAETVRVRIQKTIVPSHCQRAKHNPIEASGIALRQIVGD